jgi:electron transport complex protein RnfD
MKAVVPGSAPFVHANASVPRTMGLVMLALVPATLFGLYQFGWPAIILFALTIASALAFEALSLAIAGRPLKPFLTDGSAVLTGWLLALSLPPYAPWWLAVLGGFIAIVVGKQIYGGLGQNIFNPAMVARIALLISFPLQMTFYLQPRPLLAEGSPALGESLRLVFLDGFDIDALSSASTLTHLKVVTHDGRNIVEAGGFVRDLGSTLLATLPGSLGEYSLLLLLAGGLFLLLLRIISWHTPVAMLASLLAVASLFHLIDPTRFPDGLYHIASGAFVFAAFFIATDYVTQPISPLGRLIFGAGIGILTFFIRSFSVFPEGVGFAVLLMNGVTPMIDHYIRPRIFGRTRAGKPLPQQEVE